MKTKMTLYDWHGQNVDARPCTDVAPTVMAGYGEGGSTKPLVVKIIENDVPVTKKTIGGNSFRTRHNTKDRYK